MASYAETFVHMDRDLALEFIVAFGRLEYAMKAYKLLKDKEYADPDWKTFPDHLDKATGETLGVTFYEFVRERANDAPDVAYLMEKPARTQTQKDGQMGWEPPYAVRDTKLLTKAIKTTRNNLFHGGKYIEGDDWQRNARLIAGSLRVIELILEADSDLAFHFAH